MPPAHAFGQPRSTGRGLLSLQRVAVLVSLLLLHLCASRASAADLEEARQLFLSGKYADTVKAAEKGVMEQGYDEGWRLLYAKVLLAQGRNDAACNAISNAVTRFSSSVQLRLLGYEVYRQSGLTNRASDLLNEINYLGTSRSWAYRDAPNMVAIGRAALLLGGDPKRVLDMLFEPARKAAPELRDTHLAIGQLALDKQDYALAAKTFEAARKQFPKDPDILFGLAQAYAPSDRAEMSKFLAAVLDANPFHVPALLRMTDNLIDAEQYGPAEETLQKVFQVNPHQPEAWAYRAVIAHVKGDKAGEEKARNEALKSWPANPGVDYLIGLKLSQKYRFAEGAAHQRQALAFDENDLPAQLQLAQDLLRLGQSDEGWKLVEAVHASDGYDVTAYNLTALRDTLKGYTTLTNEHFIVRLLPNEADVFGARALALLERARTELMRKYGVDLPGQITVEIYGDQKDFGVRTFGMPDNPGFLGVCFGRVVTANSPSAQAGHLANWEAVLWHEFCHVITLSLTRNRMPRWLSEGISVYEERQANPSWGQAMNPRYRAMIMGDELTPVSRLSSAFLNARTGEQIQFAYYESSLVVQFLVEKFGFDHLKLVLTDLANGVVMNDALASRIAPLEQLEKDFSAYAKAKAEELAPGLDWAAPPTGKGPLAGYDWTLLNSNNYYRLHHEAHTLLQDKKWQEARVPLQKLVDLYPNETGPESAGALLAGVFRQLGDVAAERAVLAKIVVQDDDAIDAYARLMELAAAQSDWPVVLANAERYIAVNPLIGVPYQYRAQAAEALHRNNLAVASYQTWLKLDPADPAEVHYKLARLLRETDAAAARRQVLQALEEAPRYRAAHELLLQLGASATP